MNRNSSHASCWSLRRDLELYAEGELHDERTLDRVRLHLEECLACEDYLRLYDELTAALLAGAASPYGQGERVDRIIERCCGVEPGLVPLSTAPAREGAQDIRPRRLPETPEAAPMAAPWAVLETGLHPHAVHRSAREKSAWIRPALLAASLLLTAGLVVPAYIRIPLGRSTGTERDPVAIASIAPLEAGASLAGAEKPDAAASKGESIGASRGGDLHWILDDEPLNGMPSSGAVSNLLRLRGFPSALNDFAASEESSADAAPEWREWVVDAVPGGGHRPRTAEKYFLVAEDPGPSKDPPAPVEIDPVTWFASRRSGVHRLEIGNGKATLYRVHVLHGPPALRGNVPPGVDQLLSPVPLLPGKLPGVQWTVPANWRP